VTALRTPEEWSRLEDVLILDPDGWRTPGQSWDEPVTLAEFRARLSLCTAMSPRPEWVS